MTEIDICNKALYSLKQKAITGSNVPSPDNSPEARACNLFYQQARDELLQSRRWSFATQQLKLTTPAVGVVPSPWGFAYTLPPPTQCLAVFEQVNPLGWTCDPLPFIVQLNAAGTGRILCTDQEQPTIAYAFPQADVTLFSPMFVGALAKHLAALVAPYIEVNVDLVKLVLQQDPLMTAAAHAADASESRWPWQPPDSPLITGRL